MSPSPDPMPPQRVARLWHGRLPTSKADAYFELMERVALPDYRATPGNLGAWALRRGEFVIHYLVDSASP